MYSVWALMSGMQLLLGGCGKAAETIHTLYLSMVHGLIEAARMSGVMAWEILWALCLGFLLSSVVEAVVSKAQMSRLLPDSSAKTIVKASALGAEIGRAEEHTSELQSLRHLVCRL